jgi:acyl-CoA hydrolase/ribosomal protein S18 acetylase RimI-like enzyme
MEVQRGQLSLDRLRELYPSKFVNIERVFSKIHRGHRIFIGTGCGEPQFLVRSLAEYLDRNPKAFFDAEVMHIWSLGVAPYADSNYKTNFRQNTFFIGNNTREAVNEGMADYTPIFLSQVPKLFARNLVPIDVALIQTSMPDDTGHMSLGVSVDICKAAVEIADLVIVQVNSHMPRILGNSFIHVKDVDYILPHDEPLLEFTPDTDSGVSQKIGKYVSRLVQDGDTIQVGYGSVPNAILSNLKNKKNLGVHTELISDGIVELMRDGVINNSKKTLNKGKAVASFCMGRASTYEYLNDNPSIEFRPISYTNNPLKIAQHENMVAINSCLEVDLTGQVTSESIGSFMFSGIGGQADFMRGAVLAPNGKAILSMPSTANNGKDSRIVPFMQEGAGTSLIRGDVHYVVTEFGIAYLHGKNIRERAMELISIAHPKFRSWLIQEAKKKNIIYKDQAFVPGKSGEYPEELETYRTTRKGFEVFFRPVKISDEALLKDFFYSLSDESLYKRFISSRKDMPHERLQEFCVIDYSREMVVLATVQKGDKELVVGLGQYGIDERSHNAEVAFVSRDDYQNRGIGRELLNYLTLLAKRQGLHGFTAEVLVGNDPMLHLFQTAGFDINQRSVMDGDACYELTMMFKGN